MTQRRRQESQDAQRRLEDFRDVLEVAKNTLGNSAGALARKRAENVNLTAQIDEKRVKLESARRKYQVITMIMIILTTTRRHWWGFGGENRQAMSVLLWKRANLRRC